MPETKRVVTTMRRTDDRIGIRNAQFSFNFMVCKSRVGFAASKEGVQREEKHVFRALPQQRYITTRRGFHEQH